MYEHYKLNDTTNYYTTLLINLWHYKLIYDTIN